MLVVTHEMRFARDISDRAVFMHAGEIVEQGPARKFFARPGIETSQGLPAPCQ